MGAESFLTLQIVDFVEGVDDRVAALLQAGTGITLTYNDGAGTLTIANTGLSGSTGSTDNRILRADGTGGSTVQNSAVTIDDSGNISGLGTVGCGAITASGVVGVPAGTAAAPGLKVGNAQSGLYQSTNALNLVVNGSTRAWADANSVWNTSYISLVLGTSYIQFANGAMLYAGLSNTLEQYNGGALTSAQTYRLYNTRPSSTNFEALQSQWASNEARIGTAVGSLGGTQRNTVLGGWNSSNTWTAALAVNTTGTITCQNGFELASRTKAAVLASSTAVNSGRFQLSDAGLIGREVYPDGANWRYASDDSIVT